MKDKIRNTNIVAAVTIVILLVVCLIMVGKVSKKLAFTIDQVELMNREKLTIGKNSDINYKNVPHDYLTVWRDGNAYRWEVNKEYEDSLQYIKINNINPNKYEIKKDKSQQLVFNLPTDNDTLCLTITGEDVWDDWEKRFENQQDVMVRHFAASYRLAHRDSTGQDSLCSLSMIQRQDVRSFFEKKGKSLVLVILDKFTSIKAKNDADKDTTYTFARSGRTADYGDESSHCKVQFYTISTHCYLDKSPKPGTFRIDGVNYAMKATVKLTEWGAGHVMIEPGKTSKSILLSFPKPITFVGTIDSLLSKAKHSSDVITLKQSNNSFPTKGDLSLPTFSNAINFDLCNIEFFHQGDSSVVIRDNSYRTYIVSGSNNSVLPFSLVPTLNKVTLHSGNDLLHARIGIIDQGFFLSYLSLPFIVFFLLMLLIWNPLSALKIPDSELNRTINPEQIHHYRAYLSLLLVVCLMYCVCKSMIAFKLSYTYPYFEKLTGITPIASSLMMLLFFSLAMLLNVSLLRKSGIYEDLYGQRHFKKHKQWLCWASCLAILLALAATFFGVLDNKVSAGSLSSYFRSETYILNPLEWHLKTSVGINDTHRSVVYTLLLTIFLVLLIWGGITFAYIKSFEFINKRVDTLNNWAIKVTTWLSGIWYTCKAKVCKSTNFKSSISNRLYSVLILGLTIAFCLLLYCLIAWFIPLLPMVTGYAFILLIIVLILAILSLYIYSAIIGMIKVLFPSHIFLLIAIVVAGYLGNYGTALITFGVIIGLSRALSVSASEMSDKNGRPREIILLQMFMIVLVYTLFAMLADHGYMTNFLGFVMFMLTMFAVVKRAEASTNPHTLKEAKREKRWFSFVLACICVLALLMPWICSNMFNPEDVNYSRMSRRVMLYSNFEELQKSGYRYSESDAEFMVIMGHYMQGDSLASHDPDPLSNESHFMHPSISSGQSPVVLNDLSVPVAFFGSFGQLMTRLVYFTLLALLMWIVLRYTFILPYGDRNSTDKLYMTRAMQWRLLAMFMWVGTTLYLYLSYVDWLPFTGRLNPGYGVDAVGEALESAFLLAFMASVVSPKDE